MRFRLLPAALQLTQTSAEIIPGISKGRLQFERAAIGGLGFGEALETLQHIAAVTVRLSEIGLCTATARS